MSESKKRIYGYIRVSSKEQNENRQLDALQKLGIPVGNIYVDKESGKDFNRTGYQKLLQKLDQDCTLYVKSIDRLGRNYNEILEHLEQWRYLTKQINADVVVIDMPLLDTRRGKDLMGTFLADVVLALLSYVAENERKNILKRQAEGIAAAKLRGKKFGRPKKAVPDNFIQTADLYESRQVSLSEAAKICNMPRSTFYYKAKEYERKCRN